MDTLTDMIGRTTITIIVLAIYPLLVLGDAVWWGLHKIWNYFDEEDE